MSDYIETNLSNILTLAQDNSLEFQSSYQSMYALLISLGLMSRDGALVYNKLCPNLKCDVDRPDTWCHQDFGSEHYNPFYVHSKICEWGRYNLLSNFLVHLNLLAATDYKDAKTYEELILTSMNLWAHISKTSEICKIIDTYRDMLVNDEVTHLSDIYHNSLIDRQILSNCWIDGSLSSLYKQLVV